MRITAIIALLLLVTAAAFGQKKTESKLNYHGFSEQTTFRSVKETNKPVVKKKPVQKKALNTEYIPVLNIYNDDSSAIVIDNAIEVNIGDDWRGYKVGADAVKPIYSFVSGVNEVKPDTIRIRDTIRIHDTVSVPVFFVDVTDTVKATVLYKKDEKSERVYTISGFALIRGFKTMVKGQPQWADQPKIVGALDGRKRVVANVIQVF